jgi:hypothetical protein
VTNGASCNLLCCLKQHCSRPGPRTSSHSCLAWACAGYHCPTLGLFWLLYWQCTQVTVLARALCERAGSCSLRICTALCIRPAIRVPCHYSANVSVSISPPARLGVTRLYHRPGLPKRSCTALLQLLSAFATVQFGFTAIATRHGTGISGDGFQAEEFRHLMLALSPWPIPSPRRPL